MVVCFAYERFRELVTKRQSVIRSKLNIPSSRWQLCHHFAAALAITVRPVAYLSQLEGTNATEDSDLIVAAGQQIYSVVWQHAHNVRHKPARSKIQCIPTVTDVLMWALLTKQAC